MGALVVDLAKYRSEESILDAEEAQLLEAIGRLDPDYRVGFARALIENLLSLDLEGPAMKAQRERFLAMLVMFARDE
jgi:hypothetical protein